MNKSRETLSVRGMQGRYARAVRPLVLLGLFAALVLASCSSSGSSAKKLDGPPKVPNVVGRALPEARNILEAAGFNHDKKDLIRGRMVLSDKNWVVVTQTPAAGTAAPKGATVMLGVTKKGETVPPPTSATTTAPTTTAPVTTAPPMTEPPITAPPTTAEPDHPISPETAMVACDSAGDSEFPYGYKPHWITGRLAETWENDHWFLKVGATITNGFNAERDVTVECEVSGTDDAPNLTKFYAY